MKEVDEALLIQLAETFHLLGEPNRLRIVIACRGDPVNVQKIAKQLDLSPSLTSHHLRLLKASRVLKAQRDGRHVRYRLADQHIHQLLENMLTHMEEPIDG